MFWESFQFHSCLLEKKNNFKVNSVIWQRGAPTPRSKTEENYQDSHSIFSNTFKQMKHSFLKRADIGRIFMKVLWELKEGKEFS